MKNYTIAMAITCLITSIVIIPLFLYLPEVLLALTIAFVICVFILTIINEHKHH